MKYLIILSICMSLAVGGSCMASQKPEARTDRDTQTVVRDNNTFAFELFDKLRKEEGNLFFSPFSISSALAMTYAGAKGETASQIAGTLHFGLVEKSLHRTFGGLTRSMNERGETGGYQLSVANALWGQKGARFLEDFLELTQAAYSAGLNSVDFVADPEAARQTINKWVEEKTMEKIKELLTQGTINKDTRLVLTNAIYFKGDWASQFDENRTEDAPFYLVNGTSVDVPMMFQTTEFPYMETEDFQAVGLPYVNKELSMVVLLPREVGGLEELEETLSCQKLSDLLSEQRERKVKVFLPRFKVTSSFMLNDHLGSMGMKNAFNPSLADFSGMTGNKDFFISAVVHKAFVDVNEEGTEAAAATGVVMGITSVMEPEPIPVFRADHPFVFVIRDNKTGSILFFGRLMNPNG